MLSPALATMLAVVVTDAVADAAVLDEVLRAATARSFDRVDTDGCMSTNDTVLLLASGASGVTPTTAELQSAVSAVCHDLAQQMVRDAEGASKDIAVEVVGAASVDDALEAARAVGRSNLLKCALHGNDPNWGRVLAAVGTTRAAFEPDELDVAINGVQVCRAGAPGDDRAAGRPVGPRRPHRRRPARRPARGDALDERPHGRVRPREQRVLDVTHRRPPGATPRCPRQPRSSRRCPGSSGSPAAPSW